VEELGDVLPWLRLALVVAFALLATVALVRASRSGAVGWWAAAMFGSLAFALAGAWLPDELAVELPWWLDALWVVLLLLAFPYLLLRFTASFRSLPRWLEYLAATLAVGGVIATVVREAIPEARLGQPWDSYVPVMLAYWLLVSLVSVVRLWQAGRGQPTVARRRMRLMSVAAAVLALAVLAEVQLNDVPVPLRLSVLLAALFSEAAFGLGFRPPRAVRLSWRQTEERYLQTATVAVLRATTAEEVARELLPPTVRLVGGAGAVLVDPQSRVTSSYGQAPATGTTLELGEESDPNGRAAREAIPLGPGRGRLVVWTSRYTPFFGHEEVSLLRNMGAIASLALERCQLLEAERARRTAVEEAQRDAEEAREEATRANTAKSEFLSRMSHELRTPLNAILGFGQLLEISAGIDDDDREAVEHILKAGRHLLALINDVLDLSRIEVGMMTISLEPVHTGELVHDAVALIQPLADRRSIRLNVDSSRCDLYVTTDRQRCRQVLLNLLSNAVKYNRDGGEVDVACRHSAEGTLRISVRDSGPGIDPARQHRLFEPFDRLGAESSGVEGTGLGLALSKQLVERLGGSIGVDTAVKQGSTFWIDLPVTDCPANADEPHNDPPPAAPGEERKLLLVEDNLANLRVVEAMLRQRPGIAVLPAMQGKLATELAAEHHPDVIVLDLHLPDVSGREVLNRLLADPRTRDIPVVIASADASPGRLRQLREQGAFDYVTKPLDLRQFLEVLDAALEHHALVHPELKAGPGAAGDGHSPPP